ncbi:hypothetical protein AB7942_00245 [Neobacillus sp. BF23-41]|uniref:hypothetical protein n=1 Tax=Neobacillus sp. BF23-41 TaxID=3240280 RepID=UPI0034E3776C
MDTGFLSVPYIMDVLCENEYEYLAYKLLFQTACPSTSFTICFPLNMYITIRRAF